MDDPIAALFALGDGRFEWVDGRVVEHVPPTVGECLLRGFLATLLDTYAEETVGGCVLWGGFLQRLDERTVRTPDVSYLRPTRLHDVHKTHLEGGADLVIEIVSPESGARDRGEKFDEYEQAGIEEYWIVDPRRRIAGFYRLRDGLYALILPDAEGKAYSSALPGFFVRVEWLWDPPKLIDALRALRVLLPDYPP